jgi:glycogen synthase
MDMLNVNSNGVPSSKMSAAHSRKAQAPISTGSEPPRIVLFDGPGDTMSAFRRWRAGEDHPGETAVTYSSQFFDVAERMGARVLALSCHTREGRLEDGNFLIEHRAAPWPMAKGVSFHIAQAMWAAALMREVLRFRANVAVLGDSPHPVLFAPLHAMGVMLVPALHCAFWPQGHGFSGPIERRMSTLNGWFFRNVADATLAISPECERQVRTIAGTVKGPIHQYRAKYRTRLAEPPPGPANKPFRVMFAGRCEAEKGVFHLLTVAHRLEQKRPGDFRWTVCGGGGAEARLRAEVEKLGLGHCVVLRGQLQRTELTAEYTNCDAVFVPTTSHFTEGLNKVTLEGLLSGRPVVASTTTHAGELLGDAGFLVTSEDLAGYQNALERLADDADLYRRCCAATLSASASLVNSDIAFEAVLERTLRTLLEAQARARSGATTAAIAG